MHATRVVMFLLGAWILGALGVDLAAYGNLRLPAAILEAAPPEAESLIKTFGAESSSLLLRYSAAEGDRLLLERWGIVAIVLGLLLVPSVYIATDRRVIPTVAAALMLAGALFGYFSVTPELAYRTRQVDFPPGRGNVDLQARARSVAKVYLAVDAAEMLLGAVLALYIVSYKSRRRANSRGRDAALKVVTARGAED